MATTVAQLIEFLKQFPEDTQVEVLAGQTSRNYSGDMFGRVDMSLEKNYEGDSSYSSGTSWEFTGKSVDSKTGMVYPGSLFLGEED